MKTKSQKSYQDQENQEDQTLPMEEDYMPLAEIADEDIEALANLIKSFRKSEKPVGSKSQNR